MKQKPMPSWYLADTDYCWFCHAERRNNCNQCKVLKQRMAEIEKKQKLGEAYE